MRSRPRRFSTCPPIGWWNWARKSSFERAGGRVSRQLLDALFAVIEPDALLAFLNEKLPDPEEKRGATVQLARPELRAIPDTEILRALLPEPLYEYGTEAGLSGMYALSFALRS